MVKVVRRDVVSKLVPLADVSVLVLVVDVPVKRKKNINI